MNHGVAVRAQGDQLVHRVNLIVSPERSQWPDMMNSSALTGRASSLRDSEGLHAMSPVLYSAACIFRAPQNCSSPSMTAGIRSSKNSATASLPGPASALSACSPAVPSSWACVVTAAHRPTAPIPASSARAVSQKPAAPAASKLRSSGCRSRVISFPTATGSISPSPCPTCCGPSSTTTPQRPVPGCLPGYTPVGA